ncbi:hypothetical protein JXQ70_08650 [bacterium]|nr:hypothetical protein [bacterium]
MNIVNYPSFKLNCENPQLTVGVLFADQVKVKPTDESLRNSIQQLCQRIRIEQHFAAELTREPIRSMLRYGGYKPSGRGRPASEYLANAVLKGDFPQINNVVDINNYISLKYGLPICLLDCEKTGQRLELRYGRADESYVFNQSGQSIQLKGLLCICGLSDADESLPFGNPIKDSLIGKITEITHSVIGVVFSTPSLFSSEDEFTQIMIEFKHLLQHYADAQNSRFDVFTG